MRCRGVPQGRGPQPPLHTYGVSNALRPGGDADLGRCLAERGSQLPPRQGPSGPPRHLLGCLAVQAQLRRSCGSDAAYTTTTRRAQLALLCGRVSRHPPLSKQPRIEALPGTVAQAAAPSWGLVFVLALYTTVAGAYVRRLEIETQIRAHVADYEPCTCLHQSSVTGWQHRWQKLGRRRVRPRAPDM